MGTLSKYGMGCGSLVAVAGLIELLLIFFGWELPARTLLVWVEIVGYLVGSPVLGAILCILLGLLMVTVGYIIRAEFGPEKLTRDGSLGKVEALEGATAQPLRSYMPDPAENYLSVVENTMRRNGVEPVQFSADTRAFYKEDSRRSSESYFVLGRVDGELTPEKVQKISQRTFDFVSKKKWANVLYCYPVIITENVSPAVQKFIHSYNPKHMSKFEFPVIVDLSSRRLYYYPGTPLWGGLMYGSMRKDIDLLLGFSGM